MQNNLEKHLHIICLNVPYPADYGGVFDLFYKLPALQQQGVKIHLHCFEYGRGEQQALNQFCDSVHYYKRKTGVSALSIKYPYIVSSRMSSILMNILAADDYPILMEGVHCTGLLHDHRFANRKCVVRLHNVEHIYYRYLAKNTTSFLKKIFFLYESLLLKKYEKSIAAKAAFWGVIEKDNEVYRGLGGLNIEFLPLFLPGWDTQTQAGSGIYCLYQGDLSVGENEKAAHWLIKNVFGAPETNLVIAGKNPPDQLIYFAKNKKNICLVANPTQAEMQNLIEKAHINIIPSFNNTGIKIKLVNALYNGRHCLVNKSTVEGTGLESLCHIAESAVEFKYAVTQLYAQPFVEKDIAVRKKILSEMFDNERNARQMVQWIWG